MNTHGAVMLMMDFATIMIGSALTGKGSDGMDREKVIKGLEEISDYFFSVYHHSKDREEIDKAKDRCDAVEDALALLKEQEAVKKCCRDCEYYGACHDE